MSLPSSRFYAFHDSLLTSILRISCPSSASTCSQFLATSRFWSFLIAWAFLVQIYLAPGSSKSSKTRGTQPLPLFIYVYRTALNFSDDGTLTTKAQHAYSNDGSNTPNSVTSGLAYASARHAIIDIQISTRTSCRFVVTTPVYFTVLRGDNIGTAIANAKDMFV
jgi:hypothetical protein